MPGSEGIPAGEVDWVPRAGGKWNVSAPIEIRERENDAARSIDLRQHRLRGGVGDATEFLVDESLFLGGRAQPGHEAVGLRPARGV